MTPLLHIVFFSSGASSWAAAKRVVDRYGAAPVRLVFADTLIEDEDNYRFLKEGASHIGAELVHLCDGRTPWEVFKHKRHIGNTRVANCSHVLKQDVCRAYVKELLAGGFEVRLYLGIDWQEAHRMESIQKAWAPLDVEFPLCWEPWLDREATHQLVRDAGLALPRLYDLGFAHANCGGFCVKGGHAQFRHLLKTFPERYAEHERQEQEMRDYLDKDVSILRDRRHGKTKPLTMRQLRENEEASDQGDLLDWGGCNCFIGSE